MACRTTLAATGGDLDAAIERLRDAQTTMAAKKADREATEGLVALAVDGQRGAIVEVNCETDFVARGEDFQRFIKDLAMHICASEPLYVSKEEIPAEIVEKEREIARSQATADPKNANKPANIIDKMIDGRMEKFFTEVALLEQPFVKDQTLTINDLVKQVTAKTGEKISIRRFTRYKMGEGLEKRGDDFAQEVANLTNQ